MADAAVAALLREGESVNTQLSYGSALRYWAAWFAVRYQDTIRLPVEPATVLQFIVDQLERTGDEGVLMHELPEPIDTLLVSEGFKGKLGALSLNTVGHRLAVLSKLHTMHEQPNPCRDEAVRDLTNAVPQCGARAL